MIERIQTEQVRLVGAIEVLIGAVAGLSILLGADESIVASAVVVATAVVGVVTAFYTRSKVTPYHPEAEYEPGSMDGV